MFYYKSSSSLTKTTGVPSNYKAWLRQFTILMNISIFYQVPDQIGMGEGILLKNYIYIGCWKKIHQWTKMIQLLQVVSVMNIP